MRWALPTNAWNPSTRRWQEINLHMAQHYWTVFTRHRQPTRHTAGLFHSPRACRWSGRHSRCLPSSQIPWTSSSCQLFSGRHLQQQEDTKCNQHRHWALCGGVMHRPTPLRGGDRSSMTVNGEVEVIMISNRALSPITASGRIHLVQPKNNTNPILPSSTCHWHYSLLHYSFCTASVLS